MNIAVSNVVCHRKPRFLLSDTGPAGRGGMSQQTHAQFQTSQCINFPAEQLGVPAQVPVLSQFIFCATSFLGRPLQITRMCLSRALRHSWCTGSFTAVYPLRNKVGFSAVQANCFFSKEAPDISFRTSIGQN